MVLDESARKLLLSDETEKQWLLRAQGMDEVKILQFDHHLAETRPFGFFRDWLLKKFDARGVVVGADFRFGAGRSAGAVELVRWGIDFGIPVWVISPVKFRRQVVSSTLIRGLFEQGKFKAACDFLGHPYLIAGRVVKGRGVGRGIGFPTANLQTRPEKVLPTGVFAVRARVGASPASARRAIDGVANIGVRPTFIETSHPLVEVHLFGKPGELVGKFMSVQLVKRIRAEKKFPGVEALKAQIARDVRTARKILSASKNG